MPDEKMMRALLITKYGPPPISLSLQSIPRPTLSPSPSCTDLLVRVVASSIAPAEYGFLTGQIRILGLFPLPDRLGLDFAGVVEGVGEGAAAQGWTVGEEVLGCMKLAEKGTMQEYIVVGEECCVRKPASVGWEEAAALPSNGLTALQSLEKHEGAREAIFVTGGLGGVAHLVIQLAHHRFGFKKILTSVSTSKVAQFKALYPYVDEVIDYKTTNPISTIPKSTLSAVYSTLGTPARFIPLLSRPPPPSPPSSLIEITTVISASELEENWGVQFTWYVRWLLGAVGWWVHPRVPAGVRFVPHNTKPVPEDLREVVKEAGEGRLTPLVAKVFKLEEAAEAYELAHQGVVGKVVIRISE